MILAQSFQNSQQIEDAEALFSEAAKRVSDPSTAAAALRSSAGMALARGNVDLMRQNLERAREIFSTEKFASTPQPVQHLTNATTELQWAAAELMLNKCEKAEKHLSQAQSMTQKMPQSALKNQMKQSILQLKSQVIKC